MKKIAKLMTVLAIAAFTFTSCEDVPSPFGTVTPPTTDADDGNTELPYNSVNLNSGWTLEAVTPDQPWSQGSSYVQATGYQAWDGGTKSNRAVEGWLISPAFSTKGYENVKIFFDQTIKYTNNVSGWADYHKVYVCNNYDETNFSAATWVEVVGYKPVASPYSDWTLYSSGEIQLPTSMAGQESIRVAFWFKAPANASTTWELKNFNIEEGIADNSGGGGGGDPSAETIGTKENPLTVAQALEQINALADKGKTASKAYVKGKVVKVTTNQTNFEKYGNLNYLISDDGTESNTVTVYSGDGLDGAKFTSITDLAAGDEVIVFGTLYKYVNNSGQVTPEIDSGNYLVSLVKGSGGSTTPTGEPKGSGTLDDPFNVVAIAQEAAKLGDKEVSTQDYYFKGKICSVKYTFNATQGTANFNVSDDGSTNGTQFVCYSVYYLGNQAWVDGNTQIKVGDEVIIFGKITNYSGTLETSSKKAYIYSLNGNTEDTGGGDTPGGGDTGGNTISAAFGDLDCSDIANIKLSDGTIISLTQEGGKNPPIYHASSKMIRIYAQNAITINAGSKKIAKVEFAFDGTYGGNDAMYGEAGSNKITPTKENNIATFSNVNNSTLKVVNDFETNSGGTQFRTSKITITYAE